MKNLKRAVRAVDQVLTWTLYGATALPLLGIVAAVTYQVLARYALRRGTPWGEELPLLLNVWFSMLAAGLVLRYRGHISIEFFVRLLPRPLRWGVTKLGELGLAAFGGYLVRYGWDITARSMDVRMATLPMPLGVMYLSVPLGGAAMAFLALGLALGLLPERKLSD